jgi:hypothetical protein
VLSGKLESKEINISRLSEGVYTVRVSNSKGSMVSKLMVTK